MKTKTKKIKVGTFVKIKDTRYRHIEYEGVVTESFNDMIQIYGSGYREDLGFIELQTNEIKVTEIEPSKVKFVFDQEIRKIESSTIKAEHRLKDLQHSLKEAHELRTKFFSGLQLNEATK